VYERPGDLRTAADGADLAAALAGDPEAFRRLADCYTRELHLHCYKLMGSFHDAEDAMPETVLRTWRHLATVEGRSEFRPWL
jgi:RNA polymerase sigma-70 factor (ECF subfamily)